MNDVPGVLYVGSGGVGRQAGRQGGETEWEDALLPPQGFSTDRFLSYLASSLFCGCQAGTLTQGGISPSVTDAVCFMSSCSVFFYLFVFYNY